jgi:hypothetical protein
MASVSKSSNGMRCVPDGRSEITTWQRRTSKRGSHRRRW